MMIELGMTVKHTMSAFTGVVVQRVTYLNGCVRLAVQAAEIQNGKPLETVDFDAQELKITLRNRRSTIASSPAPDIELGMKVKDPLTGYKGVVIAVAEFLGGPVRMCVQSAAMHEGQPVEADWFYSPRLQLISTKKVKPINHSGKDEELGGPARDMGRV